jgi:hypothetical protein
MLAERNIITRRDPHLKSGLHGRWNGARRHGASTVFAHFRRVAPHRILIRNDLNLLANGDTLEPRHGSA